MPTVLVVLLIAASFIGGVMTHRVNPIHKPPPVRMGSTPMTGRCVNLVEELGCDTPELRLYVDYWEPETCLEPRRFSRRWK